MSFVRLLAIRQRPKQSPARNIPQVHAPIVPTHGQTSAIREKLTRNPRAGRLVSVTRMLEGLNRGG